MGDMREYFEDLKEINKQKRTQRKEKYKPQLIKLGAIEKSSGVYELNGWFCYPTKGFAMNKYNSKQRMNLDKFIKQNKGISKEKLIEKLTELANNLDYEVAHSEADKLLIQYINDEDIANAYDKITKYYA